MCGITGIFAFNLIGKVHKINITEATQALAHRGPDFQDIMLSEWVALGHRRLSVIDRREMANQPMWDDTQRYCIVFNGEIFNYRVLRSELQQQGISFRTESDTEVLLKLFIRHKQHCLQYLNGFFAFCIYDREEQSLFMARDRYGIKPLLYACDEDKFVFASEMKALLAYGLDKTIDSASLLTYLQLNYIPGPHSIFKSVKKMPPGFYAEVRQQEMKLQCYYQIPQPPEEGVAETYEESKRTFARLLESAVQRRLVSDVPLGSFLSGGIDSSVVATLAARHKPDLHTFSIGFRDDKFFDETRYAELVAKKIGSQHTVFSLGRHDLLEAMHPMLDYTDEPFADSSALAVYVLSGQTRQRATVALSGDGADELLAGYNKHAAALRIRQPGWVERAAIATGAISKILPQGRHTVWSNRVRQWARLYEGARLTEAERYWRWAGFATLPQALRLMAPALQTEHAQHDFDERKKNLVEPLTKKPDMNRWLQADMQLVLPNDMLMKVDLMSMAHGLEVRVPFLDVELVNYVCRLPAHYKIDRGMRKKILQDSFRDLLPRELYNRPKKGFEVPLLAWLRNEMKDEVADLLSAQAIEEQGIFSYAEVEVLKKKLFSANPGDVHARLWALVVFQRWWKKFGRPSQN